MQSHLPSQRQPLAARSLQNWSSKKSQTSWTDQRVDEIKKKYESTKIYPASQFKVRKNNEKNDKENHHQFLQNDKRDLSQKNPSVKEDRNIANHKYMNRQKMISAGIEPKISNFHLDLSYGSQKNTEGDISRSHAAQHYPSGLSSQTRRQPEIKSVRLYTETSNFPRSKEPSYKFLKANNYDNRMQNIDRINTKIRRILDSINTCEAEQFETTTNPIENTKYQLGRSVVSNCQNNQQELEETTIIEKKQIHYSNDKKYEKQAHLVRNYRSSSALNSQYLHNNQIYQSRLEPPFITNTNLTNLEQKRDFIRSSSCFSKIKQIKYSSLKNQFASRNQDKIQQIQHEIHRFHSKIEQLESQKKRLNIKYTPFESPARRVATQYTSNYDKPKHQYAKIDRKNFFKELPSRMSMGTFNDRNESNVSCIKSLKRHNYYQKYECSADPIKSIYQQEDEAYPAEHKVEKPETLKQYDNAELRQKIEKNMAERRRILSQSMNLGKNTKNQSNKLLSALCQQIALDEELRNSKDWLSQFNNPQKFQKLQKQFQQLGIQISSQLLEQEFNARDQNQTDPFFSFRQEKYDIALVASSYIQADKFWNQCILHQWNFEHIIREQKLFEQIQDNQLTIQDLVRLINIETNNFYRIRDLYLIYDRIRKVAGSTGKTVTIEQFGKVIGK